MVCTINNDMFGVPVPQRHFLFARQGDHNIHLSPYGENIGSRLLKGFMFALS